MAFNELVARCHLTSEASPFVMEGELSDGRCFHFKYRFGYATLKVAKDWPGLVVVDGVSLEPRFELDAWMTRPEFEMLMVDMIHLHNTKYGDTITVET